MCGANFIDNLGGDGAGGGGGSPEEIAESRTWDREGGGEASFVGQLAQVSV